MGEEKHVYDCVIVGGGSAGLSAALTLGRARREVLICDAGEPRNAPARESHTFFTRDGTDPLELLAIGREQLKPYGTVEFRRVGVRGVEKVGGRFEVSFAEGAARAARKVLLAFGVRDEFPDIENFGDFWGGSVFHCPFCHGFEVRDRPLAVVGNGAAAIEMTALLRSWSRDLVVCVDGEPAFSASERKLLEKHQVPVRGGKIVRFEGADGRLENIVFETGEDLPRGGALIRPRQKLRSDLAEKLGCELSDSGHVKISAFGETSVAGVYAAGDATSPMQSIAAAVAQGSIAAGAGVNRALSAEDFA